MLLEAILRSAFSLILLQLLAKLEGPKQISQLSFYDYIVGITLGSIAAVLAVDDQIHWSISTTAILTYVMLNIFFSYITTKSIYARRFLTGESNILIFHGKIIEKNLKKIHFDINDLLTQCRTQGYFDISKIEFAIMEATGNVSIMLKSEENPVTIKDMNKKVKQEELLANVIIDGNIMEKNLKSIGKNKDWLLKQLEEKNTSLDSILLAIANLNNDLYIYYKNEEMHSKDYFI